MVIEDKEYRILKFGWCIALFLAALSVQAQHTNMSGHHHPVSTAKNIYLSIMDTMMVEMDKAAAGGSAEHLFIAQMIPHHEGAIAMSRYEIAHGKNYEMVQLAKSILAEQHTEVEQLKLWLKELPLTKTAASTGYVEGMQKSMAAMMVDLPAEGQLADIDTAFARVMLPHHQAAVDMARLGIREMQDQQVTAFAKMLISSEQIEIEQMSTFIKHKK